MPYANLKRKTCVRNRKRSMSAAILAAMIAVFLGASVPHSWAEDHDNEIPFAEARIFFELNDTDGDLGIHALIDGEPWKKLEIEDPNERKMLNIKIKGRLRKQGLTELFFESAEPTFDELSPGKFFARFPEGDYEIEGKTLDGEEMESTVELTHVMPAPAGGITLNGDPVNLDNVDCDEEDTIPSVEVNANGSVVISWAPITMSHPDSEGGGAGVQPPIPVAIHNYKVVVEAELEVGGEEFAAVFSIILPPNVTAVSVPAELLGQDTDEFKYEILAREASHNQTAVESCFVLD